MQQALAVKQLNVDDIYDSADESRELAVIFESRFLAMLRATNSLVGAAFPQLQPFLLDDSATRRMLLLAAERVVRIDTTTRNAIRATLEEGQRLGLSTWEIANGSTRHDFAGIEGLFKETWKNRALTVARTELQTAQLASALDRYRATGLVQRIKIVDGDYDEACHARDGKIVPLNQPPSLLHPNCTLVIIPVVETVVHAPEPIPEEEALPLVSAALAPTGKMTRVVKAGIDEAMRAIDRVHGDGELTRIPVSQFGSKLKQAQYRYLPSGRAFEIEVSRIGDQQALSMAHEVGHFIDHQALLEPGRFASRSTPSPEMLDLLRALQNSDALKENRELRMGPSTVDRWHQGQQLRFRVKKSYLDYLLAPEEVFARAYAQYITLRSGSAAMAQSLRDILAEPLYRRQWYADDFKPIAEAFDALFKSKGWLA